MSGTSIRQLWEKLKPVVADDGLYMSLLLVLVGLAAFGLGRASAPVSLPATPGVTLVASPIAAGESAPVLPGGEGGLPDSVVASKNGTRYHLPSCPGARQISEGNKITFPSEAAARAAGYTPAANCPALNR